MPFVGESDSSSAAGPSDLHWFLPGVVLTLGLAAFSLLEIPDYSGVIGALSLLPLWFGIAVAVGGVIILIATFQMMIAGIERPLGVIRDFCITHKRRLLLILPGLLLTGMNMIVFMWVKQLLNYLVPFWADPYLAAADRFIFFTDPWRLLTWLDSFPFALFYHRGWFALMILALLKVLWSPPSDEKTALMLTYFILWSVFGPVVHTLLPAAGPVFYAHLGYGDRFAEFGMTAETQKLADYLWTIYEGGGFGPAAGISAMPSLHIATTAWLVIAIHRFARSWLIPVAALSFMIFVLSVALGWHYAVDGIVGIAATFGLWRACLWCARSRSVWTDTVAGAA